MYFLKCEKLFRSFYLLTKVQRFNFCSKNVLLIKYLKERTLLHLTGSETNNYLQSMITNDMKNFETLPSLYSLLLNSRGRVLYDILLYKLADNDYLVEYDATAIEYLEKHLVMYRLRKDVKIKPLTKLKAWVIYTETGCPIDKSTFTEISAHLSKIDGIIKVVEDPRLKELGIRVVTESSIELSKILSNFSIETSDSYRLLRYKLGVGEGVLDHPPGSCAPFDINVDLLNGVSLTKGCYIGQEMTAKSQHVFVIRKRLMPIVLQEMDSYPIFPPECPVVNENNQNLGRLRSHLGQYGLGFLKYEECEKSKIMKLKDFDVTLSTARPAWWPSKLKKENSLVI